MIVTRSKETREEPLRRRHYADEGETLKQNRDSKTQLEGKSSSILLKGGKVRVKRVKEEEEGAPEKGGERTAHKGEGF